MASTFKRTCRLVCLFIYQLIKPINLFNLYVNLFYLGALETQRSESLDFTI